MKLEKLSKNTNYAQTCWPMDSLKNNKRKNLTSHQVGHSTTKTGLRIAHSLSQFDFTLKFYPALHSNRSTVVRPTMTAIFFIYNELENPKNMTNIRATMTKPNKTNDSATLHFSDL